MAFQAWLHQYYCCSHPSDGTHTIPGAISDIHNSSDFLPWHRAFLFFHERIIQSVSGQKTFRLPVWDWESPEGCHAPWTYDSLPSPSGVSSGCKRRDLVYSVPQCELQGWLQSDKFSDFMGQPAPRQGPPTDPAASRGCAAGGPHDMVHTTLKGYMAKVPVAAIDPVFYAHHANVDRYWEHWRNHYRDRPGFEEYWPAWSVYYFYDCPHHGGKPQLVKVMPAELLDIESLGYRYDLPTVPIPDQPPIAASAKPEDPSLLFFDKPSLDRLPEILGVALGAGSIPAKLAGHQSVAARAAVSVEHPQEGRSYYVALAGVNGQPRVIIGRFGAFIDEHAGPTRLCAPACLDSTILAQVLPLIQKSAAFQVMYAVARDDCAERPEAERTGEIEGNWETAAPGSEFEFLVPDKK
jgi:hypothetical protein